MWTAIHREGRAATFGNYHIDIMISSRGGYQAKITKGSNWASVGKIEEFGTTEPSLEDVIRRFKTRYNV